METISGFKPSHKRGDLSLYNKEYGKVQGREIAQKFLDILGERLIDTKDKTVVELGSGSGSLMPFLKEHFKHAFGMDINLSILQSNKDQDGLVAGDIQDLPFAANSVDTVVTLHTLEHSPELPRALQEIERILKPEGEAVIIVPKPQFHIRQLGALFDSLALYANKEILIKKWIESDGIDKITAIMKQLKLAWDVAGQLHIQNVTPKSINSANTNLEIADKETYFIPEEFGSVWMITLKNKKPQTVLPST